ncbi:MAG TPA: flippase [Terriglobales bacterium]|nr:flippase [Terriglobales bacterium]
MSTETPESTVSVDEIGAADSGHQEFHKSVSEITRQSSVSFLGTISTLLVGYLFRIYLARNLGAELLGWNALGIGLYALFRMIGDLGMPYAAGRYVSVYSATGQNDRLRAFFWRALLWSMLGSGIFCAGLIAARHWIAVQFFHDNELAGYIPFYAFLIPVGAANSFVLQTLSGLKKVSRRTFITNFVSVPFMMVATIVAVSLGFSLRGYIVAQILGELLAMVLAILSIRRFSPIPLRFSGSWGGRLQPEVWWFALALLAMTVLEYAASRADRLILGHYLLAKEIGIYAVASSAAALCSLVLQAVNTIFGPVIADLHARQEQQLLSRLFQTVTKWVIAFTLPLILLLSVFASTVLGIFGADFQAGSVVLMILCVGQLANVGTGSVGTLLYMSGNQNKMLPVQVAAAVLAVAGNIALIPLFGIKAAAVVSVLATAVNNVVFLVVVWRKMHLFPYNASYVRLLVPVSATGAAIWFLHAYTVGRLPAVPLLLLVFMSSYVVFFGGILISGLTEDDRVVVRLMRERLGPFFKRTSSQNAQ